MLELTDKRLKDVEVVSAKGHLDQATSRLFEAHCGGLLQSGCKSLAFDFNDLQYLSSEGLRAILSVSKRIRAGGGKLVFTGIHGSIRDMFDIAGFLDAFPIRDRMDPGLA